MRGPISSKSETDTEDTDVDATGISVKVGVHYPGRSRPTSERVTGIVRYVVREVSRRQSRMIDSSEGQNMQEGWVSNFDG
jgi:hypothetical protein